MKIPIRKTNRLVPRSKWVEPKIGKLADADLCQANAFGIKKEDYLRMKVEA